MKTHKHIALVVGIVLAIAFAFIGSYSHPPSGHAAYHYDQVFAFDNTTVHAVAGSVYTPTPFLHAEFKMQRQDASSYWRPKDAAKADNTNYQLIRKKWMRSTTTIYSC